MRVLSVIGKSLKEQFRNFWVLLLTITMAPIFVGIYFLILESYAVQYDIAILNMDQGIEGDGVPVNYGALLIESSAVVLGSASDLPFRITETRSKEEGLAMLREKKADALVLIPQGFSGTLVAKHEGDTSEKADIEFIGDLTSYEYMVSAVWAQAAITRFMEEVRGETGSIGTIETSLGLSGSLTEFELMVPGLLVLALIMLMFTATIAIVVEVENKTMLRLKFSRLRTGEFLAGMSVVQVLVGLASIILALAMAIACGFNHYNAIGVFLLIAVLTSLSIIAFSLILAAVTKSVNEVLVVGNFPLFLFMFFSGAAFPLEGKALFSISGYPVSLQGLMSPTHAISALKKTMILGMPLEDVMPEITAILVLTALYFAIGLWAFRRRHMRVLQG